MKLNDLVLVDPALSTYNPIPTVQDGQHIGTNMSEGAQERQYARGSSHPSFPVNTWIIQSTKARARSVVKQLRELVGSAHLQPCYVQWEDVIVNSENDGWYHVLESTPTYTNDFTGTIPVRLVLKLAALSSRPRILGWKSTPITNALLAGPQAAIGLPPGALSQGNINRATAEGASVAVDITRPLDGSEIVVGTGAPNFTMRVRTFDKNGANPVPASGYAATWTEVYGPDHSFTGNVILTNGILLIDFVLGGSATLYHWNQGASVPSWTQVGTLDLLFDGNAGYRTGTIQSSRITRLGTEQAAVEVWYYDSASGEQASVLYKLHRGERHVDCTMVPKVGTARMSFTNLAQPLKIAVNDASAADVALGDTSLSNPTTYGATVGIGTGVSSYWFPVAMHPTGATALVTTTTLGAPNAYAATATRYGFGVAFMGGAGTARFQQECENMTKQLGAANIADAAASNGNAVATGTTQFAGATLVPGTDGIGIPSGMSYRIAARVRVTAGAPTLLIQLANGNSAQTFTATGTYGWFVNTNSIVCATGQSVQVLKNDATTGTFNFDEVALIPIGNNGEGPMDIYQQWLADHDIRYPAFF